MNYIPFTEKEINEFESENKFSVAYCNGASDDIACTITAQKNGNNIKTVLTSLELSVVGSSMIADDLSLTIQKQVWETKYKELFLELSIRYLIIQALKTKTKKLVIFTKEKMLPELLVEHEFKLQKYEQCTGSAEIKAIKCL